MVLGFTGTRYGCELSQHLSLVNILATFKEMYGDVELHHGDCLGADWEAAIISQERGIRTVAHPPTNPKHRGYHPSDVILPEKEYLARDRDIVDDSFVLIACPDGPERAKSGTWYTVRYARSLDRSIFLVYPDGEVVTSVKEAG